MILSRHLLYPHAPKTGGTSCRRLLVETLPPPVYNVRPTRLHRRIPKQGLMDIKGGQHMGLVRARDVAEADGYRLEAFSRHELVGPLVRAVDTG